MDEQPPANHPPPPLNRPRGVPVPLLLAVGALFLAVLLLLFFVDPARHAIYPMCFFKKMTGLDCPGCGGLRASHQLLHGHVGQAFRLNAMVVVGLPILGVWAAWTWRPSSRQDRPPRRDRIVWPWVVAALILLFGLIRNLPIWPFGITPM